MLPRTWRPPNPVLIKAVPRNRKGGTADRANIHVDEASPNFGMISTVVPNSTAIDATLLINRALMRPSATN